MFLVALLALLIVCAAPAWAQQKTYRADIRLTSDPKGAEGKVIGTISLRQEGGQVHIWGDLDLGSDPAAIQAFEKADPTNKATGEKAFHVHGSANYTPQPPAFGLGAHFDGTPNENHQHGLSTSPVHHLGDLGNIKIGSDGKPNVIHIDVRSTQLNLSDPTAKGYIGPKDGKPTCSLLIHGRRDDGSSGTQELGPGNSGARVLWGAIVETR
jgi:Cu/Zn superoxide dismutase